MDELKKALKEKDIIFGTKSTIKRLKLGKAKVVLIASNCPSKVKEDIEYYAKLSGVKIIKLDIPDLEVGMICKKRHSVAVLSY